jgi:hypothetical protein
MPNTLECRGDTLVYGVAIAKPEVKTDGVDPTVARLAAASLNIGTRMALTDDGQAHTKSLHRCKIQQPECRSPMSVRLRCQLLAA